jgi:DNA-binding winged helix-turn-helix (wHTH) protein
MDRIVHRILLFDRFALDLTRGCLRAGDQDIELRPKAFEVLRYLVENAGRLVGKQELYEAVPFLMTRLSNAFGSCDPNLATMSTA